MDAHGDPGYLRFRRGSFHLASVASVIAAAMIAVYALSGWNHHPNRGGILAIAVGVVVGVGVLSLLRADRVVETRWCDLFFGVWSTLYVVVICALALLDGGASSPLLITFFAPLVFAGTCYPLWLAACVGVSVVGAHLGVSLIAAPLPDPDAPIYVACLLGLVAAMCTWQAHTLERGRRELARASRTDHLTDTLNRRGFYERAAGELARAMRDDEPVSLVLVDLDGFKRVNDAYGHAAGDDLLRWVARTMRTALRPSDAAGRLGGDEFALLLPGIDAREARAVAERLRGALAGRTSASFGVGAYPGGDGIEVLLAHADAELYREKSGRREARVGDLVR